jgi:hypothetical protein
LEDSGVGTVQQATRDHAARGACADDHVVVTSDEYFAALNLAMGIIAHLLILISHD